MLKMVLTEMPYHSEEEEEQMAQILQILTVHAQLRASPDTPPERVDEVGSELWDPWFKGVGEARARLLLGPWALVFYHSSPQSETAGSDVERGWAAASEPAHWSLSVWVPRMHCVHLTCHLVMASPVTSSLT